MATHALVTSCLQFYNVLYIYMGLPSERRLKFKIIQNAADRVLNGVSGLEHTNSTLKTAALLTNLFPGLIHHASYHL